MKIAIDISPLETGHRVRGTGFYLSNLKQSLKKYHSENEYVFFKNSKLNESADLIHFPYFDPFFLTLPIRKKNKIVVTVHDLTPLVFEDKFPAGIKGKLKWKLQRRSLRSVDAVITDSYSSKKDIHKYIGISTDKIHVVYLAAASHFRKSKKSETILKKFKLPKEFLLYVGDGTWNKNLSNLIRAINKTSYHLVIAGSAFKNKDYNKSNPWNKDLHEAQVLSSKNQKIISTGFVSDSDLVGLYNLATTFIMPSYYEGFGLPILEAMQSGCPVITTRGGSLNEVGDSAVYFVDPNSVDSIKEGIEEVMCNKDLRNALSKKGLVQAKKFSWKKCADETNDVYQKVLLNE